MHSTDEATSSVSAPHVTALEQDRIAIAAALSFHQMQRLMHVADEAAIGQKRDRELPAH